MTRVGMFGHSRGTLTGMAAAAGSSAWGVQREPRVKAVMGMASGGTLPVTLQPNLSEISVPTLVVAGGLDQNSPLSINQALYRQIGCPVVDPANPVDCAHPKADKRFVLVPDAHHRTFISTFCDQTQAVAAIAKADPNAVFEAGALTGANGYQFLTQAVSGHAMDYCSLDTFRNPVDIAGPVHSVTGFRIPRRGRWWVPWRSRCTLRFRVHKRGVGYSFINKISYVQAALARPAARSTLSAFTREVSARSGEKISVGTAASLITDESNPGVARLLDERA